MYFTGSIIMVPSHDSSSPKQPDLQPGKKKKSQSASSNAGHSQSRYWECGVSKQTTLWEENYVLEYSNMLNSLKYN